MMCNSIVLYMLHVVLHYKGPSWDRWGVLGSRHPLQRELSLYDEPKRSRQDGLIAHSCGDVDALPNLVYTRNGMKGAAFDKACARYAVVDMC